MKLVLPLLACSAIFSQFVASAGETTPVGFSRTTLAVGTSIFVPTMLHPAVFNGPAMIAVDGATAVVDPHWAVDAFAETSFAAPVPNYPAYYLEVIEGPFEGHSFDIITNSSNAVTVPSGSIPVALIGQSVKVTIRRHTTLDDFSEGATGLTAYADGVMLFNSDGTTEVRWFDGSSWLDGSFAKAVGHSVIYPGTGFTVTVSNSTQILMAGDVKATKTAIPAYIAGTNIIGPMNPATETKLVTAGLGGALHAWTDGFQTFALDGSMLGIGVYYSDGANLLDRNFNILPAGAPDAIPPNRGFALSVYGNDIIWVSKSPIYP